MPGFAAPPPLVDPESGVPVKGGGGEDGTPEDGIVEFV